LEVEPVQERVEVPEPPLMVVGNKLHERFTVLVLTVRVTVSVKPFRGETMIVELPVSPEYNVMRFGFDVIEKSCGGPPSI